MADENPLADDAPLPAGSAPLRAPSRIGLPGADWQARLEHVSALMRDLSRETDPQRMVRRYARGMREVIPRDRLVAISRRDLPAGWYRITRSDLWQESPNPWTAGDRLPVFERGLLGELIHADGARIIDSIELADDEPCREYFEGMRSLIAIPVWDDGEVLNMTVMMRREEGAYDPADLPEVVWTGNLFGRATRNLVLKQRLDEAYERLDAELKVVAEIQRSLLPRVLPDIPTLDLATHYETSQHAGGDYYDFFPLEEGRWGILVADVCGHGTPAAVLMAITHALAHHFPHDYTCPSCLLRYVNDRLNARYVQQGSFITAFFGVYDPTTRRLEYASAGHNPPRVKRCSDGTLHVLDRAGDVPLGILPDVQYGKASIDLVPGDQMILYTDGITEARSPDGDLFGTERLDAVLENCGIDAHGLIRSVEDAVEAFTRGRPADDDRTMVVGVVR